MSEKLTLGHSYKCSGIAFKGETEPADSCVHEDVSKWGMRVCGQPRAAHEPKPETPTPEQADPWCDDCQGYSHRPDCPSRLPVRQSTGNTVQRAEQVPAPDERAEALAIKLESVLDYNECVNVIAAEIHAAEERGRREERDETLTWLEPMTRGPLPTTSGRRRGAKSALRFVEKWLRARSTSGAQEGD